VGILGRIGASRGRCKCACGRIGVSAYRRKAVGPAPVELSFSTTLRGDHVHQAELKLSPTGSGHADTLIHRYADTMAAACRVTLAYKVAPELK
jgi:hypothetical protein